MSSSGSVFMDRNKDYVLKLKIEAEDGTTQLRRIRLLRITNHAGIVSYDELVGLVVTFVFPEHQNGDAGGFHVTITYLDSDEDRVTIGSTDELLDAVEQFAEQRVLRITAEVKPKRIPATPELPSNRKKMGSNVTQTNTSPEAPLHTMLESFVGVLAKAVLTLEKGLSTPPPGLPGSTPSPTEAPSSHVVAHDSSTNPTQNGDAANSSGNEGSNGNHQTVVVERRVNDAEEGAASVIKPFIHGRHTCDSCLKTPIIGKRFHAKNLPDYDLCSRCFENYQGAEIEFEPVELVRDRAFQERWHRRNARRMRNQPTSRPSHGDGDRRHRGYQGAGDRGGNHPQVSQQPPSQTQNDQIHGFDDALKEAIRRSLQDVASKEPEHPPVEVLQNSRDSTVTVTEEEETAQVQLEPAAPLVQPLIEHLSMEEHQTELVKEAAIVEDVQEIQASLTDMTLSEEETRVVEEACEPQEEPESVMVLAESSNESDEDALARVNCHLPIIPPNQDPEDIYNLSHAFICNSDSSMDAKSSASKSPRSTPSKFRDAEDSFASDAKGSGSGAVAEEMGATLDMVADMITEMLSEADAHNVDSDGEDESSDSDASTGGLILESVKASSANTNDVPSESDSWDLVSAGSQDNDQALSGQDGDLGRAAEMLGSALFSSDMKSSAEAISALSQSDAPFHDSFSAVSSVPSSVHSLSVAHSSSAPSNPQGDFWAAHLKRLHEIGFDDTSKNVEILERMEATRISAGSEEEVSVAQVVDELLKQYETS